MIKCFNVAFSSEFHYTHICLPIPCSNQQLPWNRWIKFDEIFTEPLYNDAIVHLLFCSSILKLKSLIGYLEWFLGRALGVSPNGLCSHFFLIFTVVILLFIKLKNIFQKIRVPTNVVTWLFNIGVYNIKLTKMFVSRGK